MAFPIRTSKKELRAQLEKCRVELGIVRATDEVQAHLKWLQLPFAIQNDIRAEWKKYYEKARESKSKLAFDMMKNGLKNGDLKLVDEAKKLIAEIKENGDYTPVPKSFKYDPDTLAMSTNVSRMRQLQDKIKSLTDQLTDKGDEMTAAESIFGI